MSRLRRFAIAAVVLAAAVIQIEAMADIGEGARFHSSLLLFPLP